MGNCYLIILDGVGAGHQEDAIDYGDQGSNTLGHVINQLQLKLPNFEKLGLGNILHLDTVLPVANPFASFGKMREVSQGKDSTTGHWEIAGVQLEQAFPTYPNGFPEEVIQTFCELTNTEFVYANAPYSGTDVIQEFGEDQMKTGQPIVYTSADSVFQIAAHTDVIPIEKLYEWCEIARNKVMIDNHLVGRVIARPFKGSPDSFQRVTDQRKDFSAEPTQHALPLFLQKHGVKTYSIGKIIDLFAGQGFNQARKTKNNAEGISQILNVMKAVENSFVFVNLIDFDQLFGHRLDTEGFGQSLQEFDRAIPAIMNQLNEDDLLIITADHGNDPTGTNTDHTREFVPLLSVQLKKKAEFLGVRSTFSDISATISDYFKINNHPYSFAESFL